MCGLAAGYLTMNETDTRSLCIPFPVGGWDAQGADENDTADAVVTPSLAASIMRDAMQPGTTQNGARMAAVMSMPMPPSLALSIYKGICTMCVLLRLGLERRHVLGLCDLPAVTCFREQFGARAGQC